MQSVHQDGRVAWVAHSRHATHDARTILRLHYTDLTRQRRPCLPPLGRRSGPGRVTRCLGPDVDSGKKDNWGLLGSLWVHCVSLRHQLSAVTTRALVRYRSSSCVSPEELSPCACPGTHTMLPQTAPKPAPRMQSLGVMPRVAGSVTHAERKQPESNASGHHHHASVCNGRGCNQRVDAHSHHRLACNRSGRAHGRHRGLIAARPNYPSRRASS